MSDSSFLVKPNRLSPGISETMLPPRPAAAAADDDDDFLSHLDPATVVNALALPTGGLRSFLDGASTVEREFAMQTAKASQSIWEWLNELNNWDWPAEGGSEGFENVHRARRKLFVKVFSPEDSTKQYVGCLLAENITKYERRVGEISRDLDELDLEDIKNRIMTHHILPLSRPTTPILDPNQLFVSSLVASCTKLDDLSAVVTAIVLQTLPNLARLSHLLQAWSMRVNVLQQVNPLLSAISDAEILLKENWAALSKLHQNITSQIIGHSTRHKLSLTKAKLIARRDALAQKVAQPGQTLDYMLDCLEGSPDTLPDDWLNRMEEVEKGYGEWVAACERWINEAELAQASGSPDDRQMNLGTDNLIVPVPMSPGFTRGSQMLDIDLSDSADTDESLFERQDPLSDDLEDLNSSPPLSPRSNIDEVFNDNSARSYKVRPLYKLDDELEESPSRGYSGVNSHGAIDDAMTTVDEETEDEDENEEYDDQLELPAFRGSSRRHRSISQTSTIADMSRGYDDFAGDFGKNRLQTFPRDRDNYSTQSSPSPETSRGGGGGLLDSPIITSIPEDDSLLSPPLNDSLFDDDDDSYLVSDANPSRRHRDSVGDIQLRQQIRQIIRSIPASIRLAADSPPSYLNPPDLQLPRLKKRSSKETIIRSSSALSTRTASPLFTLSPIKGSRTRNRGHHEIKVYHLSRNNGDAPIKLFIRCVGENGERVMVRVGGGWADLGEYLKAFVSHHGRRSSGKEKANVEVRKLKRDSLNGYTTGGSSPPSRPSSAACDRSPMTPLNIRKTRRSTGGDDFRAFPSKTPVDLTSSQQDTPQSEFSGRSRSGSHSWVDNEQSFLGMAGPSGKKVEMSEESKAWVESVKEKVRMSSSDMRSKAPDRFGELGKVGGTKRVYRKS